MSRKQDLAPRVCQHCGTQFKPKQRRSRLCSRKCIDAASREANYESYRARERAYAAANAETCRARQRAYHAADREKSRAKARAWREANLEKRKAYEQKYDDANQDARRDKARARYRLGAALASMHLLHVMQQLKQEQPE